MPYIKSALVILIYCKLLLCDELFNVFDKNDTGPLKKTGYGPVTHVLAADSAVCGISRHISHLMTPVRIGGYVGVTIIESMTQIIISYHGLKGYQL